MTSFLIPNTLDLDLEERIVFTYPLGDALGNITDSVVNGRLKLKLKRPTAVTKVSINLICQATASTDFKETHGTLIDISQTLFSTEDQNAKVKGTHIYNFAIPLQASAPPPMKKDSHGHIQYYLVATAAGAGAFGADLVQSERFSVASMRAVRGQPPQPLDAKSEDYVAGLGPIFMRLQSPALTVASLLEVELNIPEAANDATLIEASVSLIEKRAVRHFIDERTLAQKSDAIPAAPVEVTICQLDGANPPSESHGVEPRTAGGSLAQLKAGDSYTLRHLARMPYGRGTPMGNPTMCASWDENIVTPIIVSHELVFRLLVNMGGKQQVIAYRRPVAIGHCLLFAHNVSPPEYTNDDEHIDVDARPRAFTAGWGNRPSERCLCLVPFEDLVAQYRSATTSSVDAGTTYKALR